MSKRLFHWVKPRAQELNLHAGDHAVQIGHLTGDVYLVKQEVRPDPKALAETIGLHMSLPNKERRSVVKWLRDNFSVGLIKDLNRADFGLAQRYIRVVHERVNARR